MQQVISNIVTISYHSSSHNDGHEANATLGRLTQRQPKPCRHPCRLVQGRQANFQVFYFNEYITARGKVAKSKVEYLALGIYGLLVGPPANTGYLKNRQKMYTYKFNRYHYAQQRRVSLGGTRGEFS